MIRLRVTHRDLNDAKRTLMIYDRDALVESTTELITTSEFVSIKYNGDRNDIHKAMIGSTMTVTIKGRCADYDEATETAVQSFISDLGSSYEGRFYARVLYSNDVPPATTEFLGKILTELGDTLLDSEELVQITAIDGLEDLKNVEYRPIVGNDITPELNTELISMVQHIGSIIKKNSVVSYFNTVGLFGNTLMTTSINWVPQGVTLVGSNVINQLHVRNYWWEQKSKSYRKYQSCYDVLKDILTGLQCRIYQAEGKYHIEQIGYQDAATPVIYGYNYNLAVIGATFYDSKVDVNYTTDDNWQSRAYNSRGYIAPLKAVVLEQGKQFTNYIAGLTTWQIGTTYSFGNVLGDGSKLVTQWYLDVNSSLNYAQQWSENTIYILKLEWVVEIKVGNKYLKALTSPVGIAGVNEMEWVLTPTTILIKHQVSISSGATPAFFANSVRNELDKLRTTALIMESLEIADDGELSIKWVSHSGTLNTTNLNSTWQLKNPSRLILAASGHKDLYEQPDTIKRAEVGDIRNSTVYDVKMGFYDSESDKKSALYIKNSTHVAGVRTSTWIDNDNPTDVMPIQELVMRSIMAARQMPGEMKIMRMYSRIARNKPLDMRHRWVIDGDRYTPIDMEVIGGDGDVKVTLWKQYKDYDGINIVVDDTGDPDDPNPYPTPDGTLDPQSPLGGNNLSHYEEWSNVSTAYVVPGVNLADTPINDLYAMNTKYVFFINGVRQKYEEPPTALKNRRYNVDTVLGRFNFFKGSGPVDHIELFIYI